VQLEQEELARRQRAENALPARLPEVHLVEPWLGAELLEPVAIGDANEAAQRERPPDVEFRGDARSSRRQFRNFAAVSAAAPHRPLASPLHLITGAIA
jgi:hypothetical protein